METSQKCIILPFEKITASLQKTCYPCVLPGRVLSDASVSVSFHLRVSLTKYRTSDMMPAGREDIVESLVESSGCVPVSEASGWTSPGSSAFESEFRGGALFGTAFSPVTKKESFETNWGRDLDGGGRKDSVYNYLEIRSPVATDRSPKTCALLTPFRR